MDYTMYLKLYQAYTTVGANEYLDGHYNKALVQYKNALVIAEILNMREIEIAIIQYMVCSCHFKLNKLDDLLEAVTTLQNMPIGIKEELPIIYCLLAKLHCKLYRFDEGLVSLNAGEFIFNKNIVLNQYYIPETKVVIQNKNIYNQWLAVQRYCLIFHLADAVCNSLNCTNIARPYTTPNVNIYIKDPAFNGMVIVKCNNEQPCIFKYHQNCWKDKKIEIFGLENMLEKDIIGNISCFTPDCMRNNIPCIILSIEIIGKTGKVEEEFKNPTFDTHSNNKYLCNNVVKKLKNYKALKDEILITKGELDNYDTSECFETGVSKHFLLSYFHTYIKNHFVKVCDLYTEFDEINKDLKLTNIESNKVALLNDEISENDNMASNEDLGDIYNTLTNERDSNDITSSKEKLHALKFNRKHQDHDSNNEQKVIHEEILDLKNQRGNKCLLPSILNNYDVKKNDSIYQRNNTDLYKHFSIENRNYKIYVIELEEHIEKIKIENNDLHEKLMEKDSCIESLIKDQKEYFKKIEEYERFQVQYQNVKDDNLEMMEKIRYLEEKLSTHSNYNEQILKNVQEYKILEDHINSIWQSKINKFEQVLQTEIETKMNLLKTSLNRQFAQNKYVLNRFFDHYTLILNLMNTVNDWIENLIDIKLFVITNWINKRNNIQEILNDQQLQYTKYLEILNSNAVDKFKMTSIELTFPVLENISEQNVECIIKTILMVCSIIHYNFMMYPNELGCELNREQFVQNIIHLLKTIQWNISPEVILNVEIAEKLPTIICEKDMPQMQQEQRPSNDSENLEQKDCIIIENEEKFIESNEVIHKENVYHEISIYKEKEITNSIVNDDMTKDISNPSVTDYFYNGNNDDIDNACSFNNQSDYTSNVLKNECRLMYKVGLNKLVKIMLLNYSGTFETDIIEIIEDIRKNHNNSLSGLSMAEILKDSEEYFLRKQEKYVLKYDSNDQYSIEISTRSSSDSKHQNIQKRSNFESKKQNVPRSSTCPTISVSRKKKVQTQELSKSFTSSLPKVYNSSIKTWNVIPQDLKWTLSSENECSICMGTVKKINSYILACGHFFHAKCIKEWMNSETSCPNCRYLIIDIDACSSPKINK